MNFKPSSHHSDQILNSNCNNENNMIKTASEHKLLEDIIASVPGNVYWKNTEGVFLGCNNNVAHILGFDSPQDIIGKTNADFDLSDSKLAELTDESDRQVINSGKELSLEEIGLNTNREKAIYLSKKSPSLMRPVILPA